MPLNVQVSPLDSLIQGFQVGQQLTPEAIQNRNLSNQLALQLQQLQVQKVQQQLNDYLHPENAISRQIQASLAGQSLNPVSGVVPSQAGLAGETIATPKAITPEQQNTLELGQIATDQAGLPAPVIPTAQTGVPITPILNNQGTPTGFSRDLSSAIQGSQNASILSGIQNASKYNQALDLINARAKAAAENPRAFAPQVKTDANGFLVHLDPETNTSSYVLDPNGDPINVGVQQQFLNTAQGFQQVSKRTNGGNAAVPVTVTNSQGEALIPSSVTTAQNTADRKIRNDLYKAVQSNEEVKNFETISRNFENLNNVTQSALDPSNQASSVRTGADTAAIDAFNLIFNPKGVVRQFSYVNTLQNRPLLDQGESILQRWIGTGGKITPEDLQSMLSLAAQAKANAVTSVKGQLKPILSRAEKAGVAQEDILPDSLLGISGQTSQQTSTLPTYRSQEEAIAAGHKKGEKVIINGVRGTLQ